MGNPFSLINALLSSGQFSAWVDAHSEIQEENTLWELYVHKLGAWDERSFSEFQNDMLRGRNLQQTEKMSDEQLIATVQKSHELLTDFEIPQEGG